MLISTALTVVELSLVRPGAGIRLVPLQTESSEGGREADAAGVGAASPLGTQYSAPSWEVLQFCLFFQHIGVQDRRGLDEILTTCKTHGITCQLARETLGGVLTLSDSRCEQVHKKMNLGAAEVNTIKQVFSFLTQLSL